jgi:hypothetical protein
MNIKPRDVIAAIALLGGGLLLYKGVDGFVTATVTLIIGYYFGRRQDIYEVKKNGRTRTGRTKK